MDSSKRHWPSMFKSKSSINSHDTANSHPPSTISSGTEEIRTPEPKPRWNPKPEQIRILEGIFNSGMVNPPRDEIRRIRAQLQEFGQVGDASVFYWFQNRKSRSKNKKNILFQNSTTKSQRRTKYLQKSAANIRNDFSSNVLDGLNSLPTANIRNDFSSNVLDGLNSLPTCSMNQPNYLCTITSLGEFLPAEPYLFPASQSNLVGGATPISAQTILPPALSTINHIQGDQGLKKFPVFINDVVIEVASGPFDVREAFGEDAVLLHSSGQPVITDQWGITLHSLQQYAFYYLVRIVANPPPSQTHSSIHWYN